jgi:hypothetical protein
VGVYGTPSAIKPATPYSRDVPADSGWQGEDKDWPIKAASTLHEVLFMSSGYASIRHNGDNRPLRNQPPRR